MDSNVGILLSVILPVYNVEDYIEDCLVSLQNQAISNYEIIAVNDGSDDGSLKKLNSFARGDERVKVFNKDNGGLSDTRNFGLKKASGKYVIFVDSDDLVIKNSFSKMISALETHNADVLVHNFITIDADGREISVSGIHSFDYVEGIYTNEEALKKLFLQQMPHFAWIGVYRKRLFDEGISFPTGRRFEDSAVMYRILGSAKSVLFCNDRNYMYRQNGESITHNVSLQDAYDIYTNTIEMGPYIDKYYPQLSIEEAVYEISRLLNALVILIKSKDKSATGLSLEKNIKDRMVLLYSRADVRKKLFWGQKLRLFLSRVGLLRLIYSTISVIQR